jgi:hypothetical protein
MDLVGETHTSVKEVCAAKATQSTLAQAPSREVWLSPDGRGPPIHPDEVMAQQAQSRSCQDGLPPSKQPWAGAVVGHRRPRALTAVRLMAFSMAVKAPGGIGADCCDVPRLEAVEAPAYQICTHRPMRLGWGRSTSDVTPFLMMRNNLPLALGGCLATRMVHRKRWPRCRGLVSRASDCCQGVCSAHRCRCLPSIRHEPVGRAISRH